VTTLTVAETLTTPHVKCAFWCSVIILLTQELCIFIRIYKSHPFIVCMYIS